MNYLKKVFSTIYNYWYLVVLVIPLLIITLISCKKAEEKALIVSENNTYTLVNENDSSELVIPLYVASDYKFYVDDNNIVDIYLNNNLNDQYKLKLKKIESTTSSITNNEIILDKYNIICEFDYMSIDKIYIPTAYIKISYENEEVHNIQIGSFYAQKVTSTSKIKVKNLKGIVNNIIPHNNDILPSTVALLINLEAVSDLKITKIELINGSGDINQDQIIETNNIDILNNVDINEILSSKYKIDYFNSTMESILLKENETKKLILPIGYRELTPINQAGLIITYIYNNVEYKQVIDVIPIFNSSVSEKYYVYNFTPNK